MDLHGRGDVRGEGWLPPQRTVRAYDSVDGSTAARISERAADHRAVQSGAFVANQVLSAPDVRVQGHLPVVGTSSALKFCVGDPGRLFRDRRVAAHDNGSTTADKRGDNGCEGESPADHWSSMASARLCGKPSENARSCR